MSDLIAKAQGKGGSSTLAVARLNWALDRLGRAAVAFLFVDAARYHVSPGGWTSTLSDMTARGVPFAMPVLIVAMAVSSLLALALLFGVKPRLAALGLALYTLCVSSVMYNPLAGLGQMSLILFLKDVCIFGALLALSRNLSGAKWPTAGDPRA